jgi:hypothetical protein
MHSRWIVVSALTVLLGAAPATSLRAQSPESHRRGFWLSLGGGVGGAQISCDDCASSRETSAVIHVALGGTLSKNFLLGVGTNVWQKKRERFTLSLVDVLGTVTAYPKSDGNFFLKAGAGLSFAQNELNEGSNTVSVDSGVGLGVIAGAGYDIRAWKKVSITPAVSYWYGQHDSVGFGILLGESLLTNWRHNVVDFTISFTFH